MIGRHTGSVVSRRSLIAVTAAAAVAMPGAASAQDGVFVDPDSPSGKEYAIPLEAARRQADPDSSREVRVTPGQRDVSPLFGEGIESPAAGKAGASGLPRRKDRADAEGAAGDRFGDSMGDTTREALRAAVSRPAAPGADVRSTLLVVGGSAAVLLLGALGGYALRRQGRS